MRIAVVGHVEHVSVGRVPALPGEGGIAHLEDLHVFPGGGGGVTFFQLVKSPAEIHLFTALGNDQAAQEIEARLAKTGARIHAARRSEPQTRDVVLIPPGGDRTIVVLGQPLHPRLDDPLPWDLLATCDAVYFTAQDPRVLAVARKAKLLVATARRGEAIRNSGVAPDVIVGSALDPREASRLADFRTGALVMTEGAAGGFVETARGIERFAAPRLSPFAPGDGSGLGAAPGDGSGLAHGGAYGAGDSFTGALVYYLAAGAPIVEACARAAIHGAAVLAGLDPLEHQIPLTW